MQFNDHDDRLKIYVAHATSFDYQTLLYTPLKSSALLNQYQLILPHEKFNQPTHSKKVIEKANIIFAEVSYPSTGQGIELGWAEMLGKPIVCFVRVGKNYSHSLELLTDKFFIYVDSIELINNLDKYLNNCFL